MKNEAENKSTEKLDQPDDNKPVNVANKKFPPRVDTNQFELTTYEVFFPKNVRILCEYIVLYISVMLLFTTFIDLNVLLDFRYYYGVLNFTEITQDVKGTITVGYLPTIVIIVSIINTAINLLKISCFSKIISCDNSLYYTHVKKGLLTLKAIKIVLLSYYVIEVILLILWSTEINAMNDGLKEIIKNRFKYYSVHIKDKIQVDQMQMLFECCGWNNYSEWSTKEYPLTKVDSDMYRLVKNIKPTHEWELIEEKNTFTFDNKKFINLGHQPFSCCNFDSQTDCFFYDFERRENLLNHIFENRMLFNNSCEKSYMKFVKRNGLKIEGLFLFRFILEATCLVLTIMIDRSYISEYEKGHDPAISTVPNYIILLELVSIPFFYFFAFNTILL